MSQTSRDPVNSRRVRTYEKNSGDAVRRLGTIIQSIFCAQSGASIRWALYQIMFKLCLKSKGIDLLDNQSLTIRTVSEVIDLMVASFPEVHCTGPFISNTVTHGNPQVTIYSDASLTCWGGVVNSTSTGRQWSEDESKNHINLRSWHVSSP